MLICWPNWNGIQALNSTQEEADTQLFLHAKRASEHGLKSVVITAEDTDVLILSFLPRKDVLPSLPYMWNTKKYSANRHYKACKRYTGGYLSEHHWTALLHWLWHSQCICQSWKAECTEASGSKWYLPAGLQASCWSMDCIIRAIWRASGVCMLNVCTLCMHSMYALYVCMLNLYCISALQYKIAIHMWKRVSPTHHICNPLPSWNMLFQMVILVNTCK